MFVGGWVGHSPFKVWLHLSLAKLPTGRTDVKAQAPIAWPPDANSWLTGKDPNAGKDWRQEEKGTTVDEMVGWYHRLNGHELAQALGEMVKDREAWCAVVHGVAGHDWVTEQQQIIL